MKLPKVSFRVTLLLFILCVYVMFFSRGINLVISDLGRHLKNGELFFQNFSIPHTNLYSYTYPDFPFVNHHWASGVVFFLIKEFFGFFGLSVFSIILRLITFLLFFHVAWKYGRFEIAALAAVIIIPVIGSRSEIRPEIFSYLFCGLFFWILWNYREDRIKQYWLFFLPVLEIFWVNLHIYFFIGPVLIGTFILELLISYFFRKCREAIKSVKKLGAVFILTVLVTFLNPGGIDVALYPMRIFKNYAYPPFENRSFQAIEKDILHKLIVFPPLAYFKLVLCLLLASWIFVFVISRRRRERISVVNLILTLIFGIGAMSAVRNLALFGYFALPIAAVNLRSLITREADTVRDYIITFLLAILILFNLFLVNPQYWPGRNTLGLGLKRGTDRAIDFFRKENMQGPILNNYDIGGYLIYYLYPGQRVFVDNRPEAYPESFFKDIYVPLQKDEEKWKECDRRYNFNVIFFHRNVYTPWGQDFLRRRISDSLWAPVYADEYCIILLKRNNLNHPVIKEYELSKETFFPAEHK